MESMNHRLFNSTKASYTLLQYHSRTAMDAVSVVTEDVTDRESTVARSNPRNSQYD